MSDAVAGRWRIAAALLLLGFVLPAGPAHAFTVNSTVDPGDGNCDASECTLREAIGAVNASGKKGVIDFDPQVFVPGTPGIIIPTTGLPPITHGNVQVDGSGAGVVLDGTLLAAGEDGLAIESGAGQNLSKVAVTGLTVREFPGFGLVVCGGARPACTDDVSKIQIEDVVSVGNGNDGILVAGARNSSSRVTGSQVSRNGGFGIHLIASVDSDLSKAQVSGCTARANGANGIQLAASGEVVRAQISDSVAISNATAGFAIAATTDVSKVKIENLAAAFNGGTGLAVSSGAQQSRVSISDSRMASNGLQGILLFSDGSMDRAKLTKNTVLANTGIGIQIESDTSVERSKLTDNLASDNQDIGIRLEGSRNLLKGNTASANLLDGIALLETGSRSRLQKNETHANAEVGLRVATPNGANNVKQNRALGNDTADLADENASCGTNSWTKNTFTLGTDPCIQ